MNSYTLTSAILTTLLDFLGKKGIEESKEEREKEPTPRKVGKTSNVVTPEKSLEKIFDELE